MGCAKLAASMRFVHEFLRFFFSPRRHEAHKVFSLCTQRESSCTLCLCGDGFYPIKRKSPLALWLWAKGLAKNDFVIRQVLLPVPTPVGRIIIIVIIIEGDCVNQHGRYYSTRLREWGCFCTRILRKTWNCFSLLLTSFVVVCVFRLYPIPQGRYGD